VVTKQRELLKRDALVEPYRSLHGRIFKSSADRKVRSLLLTANRLREGCSTVAGNLAIYWPRRAAKTLLLELDALHPPRNPAVPAPRAAGVTDVLAGEVALEDALHEVAGTRLAVLSAGTLRDDLPALLTAAAVGDLVDRLKADFGFVVADGPPVNGLPPVAPLAARFDGVALVTQANETRRQVVQRSIDSLKAASDRFLGVVLTQRKYFIPDWIYRRL
jgi:capsular exopolysaccharide synthesis family protein